MRTMTPVTNRQKINPSINHFIIFHFFLCTSDKCESNSVAKLALFLSIDTKNRKEINPVAYRPL